MNQTVHRFAGAGNVSVLILLVLFLGNGTMLLTGTADDASPPAVDAPPGPRARQAILVVIDGLRADIATDPHAMPFLNELAGRGGWGTAQVESLIPSTIAGIITFATGAVPAPASFIFDFGAPAARSGGIFQAVHDAGGQSFMAGPQLWVDLYSAWIDASRVSASLSGDDTATLAAGLDAIRRPENRLIVLHFCQTDTVAHLHGATSSEYQQAARWCDDALRQIVRAMGEEACILIASDHGLTEAGNHAGPEPKVLQTPLVLYGPGLPTGQLGHLRQRDVPWLVLGALGEDLHGGTQRLSAASGARRTHPILLTGLVALCLYGGAALGTRLGRAAPIVHRYIALINLVIWVTLALAFIAGPEAGLALSIGVLCIAASAAGQTPNIAIAPALAAGIVLGGLRLADGLLGVKGLVYTPALPVPLAALLIVGGVTLLLGRWTGVWLLSDSRRALPASESKDFTAGLRAGILLVLISVVGGRVLGQTFSLSSIDTHTAFHVAEGPLGIPGAVLTILGREALPALGVLVGIAPVLAQLPPARAGGLAVGVAGMIVGQSVAPALVLGWASPERQVLASLSLGGLLRVISEAVYLFIPAALLSLWRPTPAPKENTPA